MENKDDDDDDVAHISQSVSVIPVPHGCAD
jgi:hypothetical protein